MKAVEIMSSLYDHTSWDNKNGAILCVFYGQLGHKVTLDITWSIVRHLSQSFSFKLTSFRSRYRTSLRLCSRARQIDMTNLHTLAMMDGGVFLIVMEYNWLEN